MATSRSIPAGVQREIERAQSQEHYLVFLTLDADPLSGVPIRVVSDPIDHTYGGDTYTGFQFEIELLSDNDRPPRAQLRVQNVDRIIGNVLRKMTNPVRVTMTLIAGSEFDQTVDPRTEVSAPSAVTYQATNLELVDVEVDALYVTGTLTVRDFTKESYPAIMATEDRFPGLFR